MDQGRGRSRSGIYAAITALAITVGLGIVGAAGADQAANEDVYARDVNGSNYCFSDDDTATECAPQETADVTINAGETVTFHFVGDVAHNAVGNGWTVPESGYVSTGSYPKTFTEPGEYTFVCALHPMSGKITVVGATATTTPSPTPTPSTQPSGPTTPPPGGGDDLVKPTVQKLRLTPLHKAVRVRFRLSEPATVTVSVKRRGSSKLLKSRRIQANAGTRSVTLRSARLKRGRYTVEVRARDAFGNRSSLAKKNLSVR